MLDIVANSKAVSENIVKSWWCIVPLKSRFYIYFEAPIW